MDLQSIKKYVINLDSRPGRLEETAEQFKNIGWEFERFAGIDLGNYLGCLQSHLQIVKSAKEQGLENVLVAEDDIIFTPWTRSLIDELTPVLSSLNFGILNLNMSIHRPVNISSDSELLLDLTNLPPKEEFHRGVYSTGLLIYNKSVYDDILKIHPNGKCDFDLEGNSMAIDEHLDKFIYPTHRSFSTIVPFCTQRNNWSDVSSHQMNNHYLQTYNWNMYTPVNLDFKWLSQHKITENTEDLNFRTIYEYK